MVTCRSPCFFFFFTCVDNYPRPKNTKWMTKNIHTIYSRFFLEDTDVQKKIWTKSENTSVSVGRVCCVIYEPFGTWVMDEATSSPLQKILRKKRASWLMSLTHVGVWPVTEVSMKAIDNDHTPKLTCAQCPVYVRPNHVCSALFFLFHEYLIELIVL